MGGFTTIMPTVVQTIHADAENLRVGSTSSSYSGIFYTVTSGYSIISQSITITKRSMVIVVALVVWGSSSADPDIRRDGVSKTIERNISSVGFGVGSVGYGHLLYACEILDPGTYTYDVVNSGSSGNCYGAAMKIIAITTE